MNDDRHHVRQEGMGDEPSSGDARRSEIVDPGGFIRSSGKTVTVLSGRESIVWEVVEPDDVSTADSTG